MPFFKDSQIEAAKKQVNAATPVEPAPVLVTPVTPTETIVIESAPIEPTTEPAKKGKLNMDDEIKPPSKFTTTKGNDLARNAKAPVYLIDGIIEQDAHGIVYGASMSFKSFAVLEMAHCIANGRDFMGHKVKKQGAVIYVCGEGAGGIGRRLKAQVITNGEFKNDFHLLNESIDIGSDDDMAQLKLLIEQIKPTLVIFDTFASLVCGVNENDNGAVGAVLNLIRDTCRNEFGTSSMIIHHTGKDDAKGSRGAYAFKANVDFEIELKKNNDFVTVMHCEKMKDGEHFNDIHMVRTVIDLGIYDDDLKESTSLVLKHAEAVKDDKNSKKLGARELDILKAIREALEKRAIPPTGKIINLFPDSPQQIPQQVVTVDALREFAYPYLSVSDNSKRTVLPRVIENLRTANKCGFHDDCVWLIQ